MSDGRDKEAPMRIVLFVVASLAAVVACRSSSTATPDTPGGGDGGGGGAVTIQDIQNGTVPTGTQVEIDNVIVTAIDNFGATTGNIWVEEPGGGPYSGVLVYHADANVIATLAIGDQVTVSNALTDQFALTGSNADPTGRTDTELEPLASGQTVTVTKTGSGTVPAPVVVDALSIGMMGDADSQGPNFSMAWRQYLGVLITVNNVSAQSAPKGFGGTPTPADDYDLGITGVAELEGSLTDITASSIARGTCFSNLTGVLDYFYNFLVLPRSSADFTIAADGSTCPQPETVCGDGIDNDGNGFGDCGDDNCIITDGTCHPTVTISALDSYADANLTAPVQSTAGAEITGACVVAVSSNKKSVWISAAGQAAANGGLLVFGSTVVPTGVVAMATVDVIGTPASFTQKSSTAPEAQLEFNQLAFTVDAPVCAPLPKTALSAAQLAVDSTGHPYIGSLVTLDTAHGGPITIATAAGAAGFGTLTQGSTTFAFGNTILGTTGGDKDAAGCSYTSITGIWTYDTTGSGSYEILPTAKPTPTDPTCNP
ncbi:MAG TPA: hypothetical protein VGF94_11840 [Kofleriaceae bacterium]|jgi:hypothetical protein